MFQDRSVFKESHFLAASSCTVAINFQDSLVSSSCVFSSLCLGILLEWD